MGPEPSIIDMEQSAEEALPPEESHRLEPWRLRCARGVYHRANSVMTSVAEIHGQQPDWSALISAAERFYRQRDLPVTFHLTRASVPANLDAELDAGAYQRGAACEVWSADAHNASAPMPLDSEFHLNLSPHTDDEWLTICYGEDSPKRRIKAEFFQRVKTPKLFALVRRENEPVACGTAVCAVDRTWIFSMYTHESARRRSLGSAILANFARWSLELGVTPLSLQVLADNSAAVGLYCRAGFARTYDYHYRYKALKI